MSEVDLDAKRSALEARLSARETERHAAAAQRKRDRLADAAENESIDVFDAEFGRRARELEQRIRSLEIVVGEDQSATLSRLNDLNADLQSLTAFFSSSGLFLASYDQRKALERLDALTNQLAERRALLIPKKKFGFVKTKKTTTTNGDATTTKGTSSHSVPHSIGVIATKTPRVKPKDEGDCVLADRSQARLHLSPSQVNGQVVGLFRLTDCDIFLRGAPSAVHACALTRCRLFAGPTSGSVFADDVTDSVFVVAAQQIRIHRTKETRFYVHVTARAIIEDSTSLTFAPYSLVYPGLDSHWTVSGLDRKKNHWDDVDDFNVLTGKSPNWGLIPEDQRTTRWNVVEDMLEDGSGEGGKDGGV